MTKKAKVIPVHSLPDGSEGGIVIGRMSGKDIPLEEVSHSHRHDFHFLLYRKKVPLLLKLILKIQTKRIFNIIHPSGSGASVFTNRQYNYMRFAHQQ